MKRKVAALEKVEADLTNLQYKIRRDPLSYEKDFGDRYATYENERDILRQAPATQTHTGLVSLRDLIDFIAHVADCYPTHTKTFSEDLISILGQHHQVLPSELREKIVGSLVLLRRKNILDSTILLNSLFPILITTGSKSLRAYLFQRILSDVRNSNATTSNHKLNRAVQRVLSDLLNADKTSIKGLWAVKLTRELWKRQIWNDVKAVELMRTAALADHEKVIMGAVRFFLGGDKEREDLEDESSDDEGADLGKLKHQMLINKKNKKRTKAVENAVASVRRKEKKKKQPHQLNFSAFHLLHDPQSFAEDLFHKHLQSAKSRLNLEQKLLVLQLVSRLVGLHKLTVLQLYSYFLKYLTPRQPSVTSFLASLAQATHNLVPPDVLEPLVMKIANQFVSEAAAAAVASAGLNAIREICARQPLAMNETLLQDLIMYRKSKDKGTMMAAKGLLSLYRELAPQLLRKRDRGKEATLGVRAGTKQMQRFGQEAAGEIEGLELLAKWKAEQAISEDDGDGWEVDEEASDDSDDWMDVPSDKEVDLSEDEHSGGNETSTKRNLQGESVSKRQRTLQGHDLVDDEVHKTEHDTDHDTDHDADHDTNHDTDHDTDHDTEGHDTINSNEYKVSLATQRILTPADLAKLQELRLAASINSHLPTSQRRGTLAGQQRHADDALTAAEIEGLASLSHKATKAEKVARARGEEGEDGGRRSHKSTQALRQEKKVASGKSTTNREKARKKNFMMTLGKAKRKDKRSLTERSRVLKAHVARGKRGGKRGNAGM